MSHLVAAVKARSTGRITWLHRYRLSANQHLRPFASGIVDEGNSLSSVTHDRIIMRYDTRISDASLFAASVVCSMLGD